MCIRTVHSVSLLTFLRLAMPSHASLNATDVTLIKVQHAVQYRGFGAGGWMLKF